ncbi:hypothetical protein FN846DRAFT_896727 [Sphaerosporella brunnea]|uniref:Uncharacterized protein n=1 Tax=Sphaerosporella brunnea TaxID=1250544 RepID=A0A5J5EBJ7_9PEZI|nr:hypothetical protein FN846DRAFT_896727 [Sphaerosporella brunnea]
MGIPVMQKAKPIWGDISKIINPPAGPVQTPTEPPLSPTATLPSISTLLTPYPTPVSLPADWAAPCLMVAPGPPHILQTAAEPSLIRNHQPPDFDQAFLSHNSFEEEARDLELWLKKQNGKVTGDWLVRVECLKDLLDLQFRKVYKDPDGKRKDWINYSEQLARRRK